MKHTFHIVALLVFGLAALVGRADTAYLYWQVNQSGDDKINFDIARVGILNASDNTPAADNVYLTTPSDSSTILYAGSADGYNIDTSIASLIGSNGTDYNSSAYNFVVELLAYERYTSGNYDVVGRSGPITYNEIKDHIAYDNMGLPAIEGALSVASFTRVVPEPTSGLMFLVGGALLALRRKRRS